MDLEKLGETGYEDGWIVGNDFYPDYQFDELLHNLPERTAEKIERAAKRGRLKWTWKKQVSWGAQEYVLVKGDFQLIEI